MNSLLAELKRRKVVRVAVVYLAEVTPTFTRILERLGVPAYWREHGFPPQCRPAGADAFECDG